MVCCLAWSATSGVSRMVMEAEVEFLDIRAARAQYYGLLLPRSRLVPPRSDPRREPRQASCGSAVGRLLSAARWAT
jgi:hypothetical protein